MDAILKLAVSGLEGTWANKDFIALLVIAYQLRSQKLIFNGKFETQEVKIIGIEKDCIKAEKKSDEAKKDSSEALLIVKEVKASTNIMEKTVTDLKDFTEGKWKEILHGEKKSTT